MYKIIFYTPESHAEKVKNAMFDTGAGQIGNYSHCSWQVLGEGQFMPRDGSNAFTGKTDELEKIKEFKIEMVCGSTVIEDALKALKDNHPYEEPAFFVFKMETF